jgi:hypothetical protein
MTTTLFHMTADASEILSAGFQDHGGCYELDTAERVGMLWATPHGESVSENAGRNDVLEVILPDDLDLADFAIVADGQPVWEWCVPADVLNASASLRLLDVSEVQDLRRGNAE